MLAALLCAGCVVVMPATPTPRPTAAVLTSTRLPALPLPVLSASPTPLTIAIVSATPNPPPSETPLASPTVTATQTPAAPSPTSPQPAPPTRPPNSTAAPISIVYFSVQPAEVRPGQPVLLAWQVVAEQIALWRLSADGRLAEAYDVPLSGTLTVAAPAEQRYRLDFLLTASAGASTASATVSARVLCPDDWFFANAPADCPAGPARQTTLAAEHFERGLMLWTQFDDRIYVLFADGTTPRWDTFANGWFPGQPEDDPDIVPPAELYQPRRGFGVAWRTGYVSPAQVVRDRLGWATEPEFEITEGYFQCDAGPSYSRCYVTGPGGVYVLEPERSGWSVLP